MPKLVEFLLVLHPKHLCNDDDCNSGRVAAEDNCNQINLCAIQVKSMNRVVDRAATALMMSVE